MTDEMAARATDVSGGIRDVVSVRLPAASAYLSVLRTATAGLAARLDFTLDEIEDLRIAVDEACAMLLTQAVPGTDLTAEFELTGQEMQVRVEVNTLLTSPPKRDDFAWMVLTALADDVEAATDSPDRMAIVLRKRRGAARPA
ncbi:anti-sigma factor [Sinosporangium siamense]|uniref:Anti-sigma regulatory factor n=1 Tax=Sinosporangium siamense TaxID=1367973 RepID=A0A919RF64_9ACTN|nr:anti-sigma factor [Sinosporangium siamense]GII92513.1 anti-sigma regulatory factor [Sinosporangium siamense]